MNEWKKICGLSDIPKLGSRVVQTAQGNIAVFRTADDVIYALHDRCPHKKGPLSQGIVAGTSVTCPLHGWKIDLESGNAELPDRGHVACVQARLDDAQEVWLYLGTLPVGHRQE